MDARCSASSVCSVLRREEIFGLRARDLMTRKPITIDQWHRRTWTQRLREWLVNLPGYGASAAAGLS